MTTDRNIAAKLARDFYAGKIDFKEFCLKFPDNKSKDKDIDELYDLIEHEPKKGGLLGIDGLNYDLYMKTIYSQIGKLEHD